MTATTDADEIEIPEHEQSGWVDPDRLTVDDDNPNDMSADEFDALKRNIREYGFVVPIVTDAEYVVADGEHRLRAAQELGMDEVWIVSIDVDDPDRRVVRQVLNKLRGDHDLYADAEEFDRILADGKRTTDDVSELIAREPDSIDRLVDTVRDGPDTTDGDDDAAENGSSADESDDGTPAGPDEVDPNDFDPDHECPRCGYEW